MGAEKDEEVLQRGYHSVSSDDDEGSGLEHAFGSGNESEYDADMEDESGMMADFA